MAASSRRRAKLPWLPLALLATLQPLHPAVVQRPPLSAVEVRQTHRAVRAKAWEALAVGDLPPGKELVLWMP